MCGRQELSNGIEQESKCDVDSRIQLSNPLATTYLTLASIVIYILWLAKNYGYSAPVTFGRVGQTLFFCVHVCVCVCLSPSGLERGT